MANPGNLTDAQMEQLAQRIAALADTPTDAPAQGVRQYVGARYVPIFADPLEWSDTREYEPLTIVTYQGNSYTSRQYIPTGIEVTDTEYWALTGNFNAQVEAYRAEVRLFDGRITANANGISALQTSDTEQNESIQALNTSVENMQKSVDALTVKKSIILIGDSFTDQNNSPVGSPWPNYLGDLGYIINNYAVRGTTFQQDTTGNGFTAQLMKAYGEFNGSGSVDNVEMIIIYGGINDYSSWKAGTITQTDTVNGMNNVVKYANEHFPKAEVFLCLINPGEPITTGYGDIPQYTDGLIPHAVLADTKGTLVKSTRWLIPYARAAWGTDKLHPSPQGARIIAMHMRNIIRHSYNNTADTYQFAILNTNDPIRTSPDSQKSGTWSTGAKKVTVKEDGTIQGRLQGVLDCPEPGSYTFQLVSPVNTVYTWGKENQGYVCLSNRVPDFMKQPVYYPNNGTLSFATIKPLNAYTVMTF